MAISEARKRANRKFDAKTYTMLGCKVRKDYAEQVKAACEAAGTTPNAIFRAALDRFMADHALDDTAVGGSELDSNKSK